MKKQNEEMIAKIKEYRAGGKTLAAYCAENEVSMDKMKYWLYRNKKIQGPSTSESPQTLTKGFICCNLIENDNKSAHLKLEIKGITITVERGFDKALLKEVTEALSA